ncbi:hypothetical protein ABBQ38_006038 [Trebouxia sp. C0009 RCD-2024]
MNVLVAVDNSEATLRLVDFAAKHFHGPDYTLHILHIQAVEAAALPGGAGAAAFAYETSDALSEEQEAEARKFLQEVVQPRLSKVNLKPVLHMKRVLGSSSSLIGETICKQAAELDAAFTLLTKSSKNAITKFFVGSVTKYCVQHSQNAVVVL